MKYKWWQAYIAWCDRMGFTENSQRCCAPRLAEPSLSNARSAQKAKAQDVTSSKLTSDEIEPSAKCSQHDSH